MKKISFILALTFIILTNSFKPAAEIKWLGFNEGYKLAKKHKKIMLIDTYTEWCGWCKRMDRDTYEKSEIAELVNKDFVAIKFNPEVAATYTFQGKTYSGNELAGVISDNQISGYPTTVFIQPKTIKKKIFVGYRNADQMKVELSAAITELNTKK
jgi:uncharacterized protein YyaL (SSP411 family)